MLNVDQVLPSRLRDRDVVAAWRNRQATLFAYCSQCRKPQFRDHIGDKSLPCVVVCKVAQDPHTSLLKVDAWFALAAAGDASASPLIRRLRVHLTLAKSRISKGPVHDSTCSSLVTVWGSIISGEVNVHGSRQTGNSRDKRRQLWSEFAVPRTFLLSGHALPPSLRHPLHR